MPPHKFPSIESAHSLVHLPAEVFTRKRTESALIDLRAETRNTVGLIDFVLDALTAFGWRVAHSPNGTMSSFRAKFYSAMN